MQDMIRFVHSRFRKHGCPDHARQSAAYLKTDMPMYGLRQKDRNIIHRQFKQRFTIDSRAEYRRVIEAFWEQPDRDSKHFAIWIACNWDEYVTLGSVPLFARMIRQGAWWDLVDGLAPHAVGDVVLKEPEKMNAKMEKWIDDPHMWIRRSAIICRLTHKERTDQRILFDHCLRRAHEKEFFIRKAIGWALRQYARTEPDAVMRFLLMNRQRLSGLSFREAAKHLNIG